MRSPLVAALAAVTALPLLAAAPLASPGDEVTEPVGEVAGVCDDLDPADCLLPFPNDFFTASAETPTGLRVDLSAAAMPRNQAGKPIDPTEWNRNDGFSPGSMLLTHAPGLDLRATFEAMPGGDRLDGAPVITDPALSIHRDAPIVVVDADTGRRVPYVAELDMHPETSDEERLLIVRPLVNFREGHRIVVGLRDLRDGEGAELAAREEFAALRDGDASGARAEHYEEAVFPVLADAGVDRDELYLAWDFTIASGDNLAGRVLSMRDQAFAQLGDEDLGDVVLEGDAPQVNDVQVEVFEDGDTWKRITGSVTVPNFLQYPQDYTTSGGGDAPQAVPGSRLYYGPESASHIAAGPMATPMVNPAAPTTEATFTCNLPRSAQDGEVARPMLYGHGLLGSKGEANGGSTERMRERGFMVCGVDWIGMAFEDVANVVTILTDMSNFSSLADRAQQGFLNFLYVGRALIHPDGLLAAAGPELTDASGDPLVQTATPGEAGTPLVYDGNSQGGIMGGALTAIAPDFTRSVLGVPGMNYSTLLNRSVDWEGELLDPDSCEVPDEPEEPCDLPAYASGAYTAYPDKQEQQIIFALIQMLWDRAEGNGYAQHMTAEPYQNTPAHQVLLHPAIGDYQVANLAAEVEARTIGAAFLDTALAPGRHWTDDAGETAIETGDRLFRFDPFVPNDDGVLTSPTGSAIVYWDSGNPLPPNANVPPSDLHEDPHGDPRDDVFAAQQKLHFYLTGEIVDVHGRLPNWTDECRGLPHPRYEGHEDGASTCGAVAPFGS